MQVIPALGNYTGNTTVQLVTGTTYNPWDISLVAFTIVIVLMFMRLLMKYISYLVMRRSAQMLLSDPVNVYQVNMNIIPFSFGKSIYINRAMHSEEELKKIIEHEFVHIKQRHSADIIWAEIFCILNWYNPFAWLIRKAIRQNLEFIADNGVLETGIDRKQYQYLLLKVTGNTSYSMGNNFNFSSLAKRIFMMNKTKSATIHLVKFLFILPLAAVMILAFRNKHNDTIPVATKVLKNTVVPAPEANPVAMLKQAVKSNPKKNPAPAVAVSTSDTSTEGSFVMDASLNGPGNPYTSRRLQHRTDSAGPLIFVNGKEYTLPLNTLDVNLIESVNVYKDRKAIEKFGTKGKNGVIEIITRENATFTITPKSPGKTTLRIYATDEKGDRKAIY